MGSPWYHPLGARHSDSPLVPVGQTQPLVNSWSLVSATALDMVVATGVGDPW